MSVVALLALALAPADDAGCVQQASMPTDVIYAPGDVVGFASLFGGVQALKDGQTLWTYTVPDVFPGDVRALRFDADGNGQIEEHTGDKVWIFFGARNASRYFALDVTDRDHPLALWELNEEDLPGIGETWSVPTLARMRIKGAEQNGEHIVIVVGGGYGTEEDALGRGLFIIDAQSGRVLWFAGSEPDADLTLPEMRYAIPSRVAVLDADGDGFADRLYVGDLGGQLWRFDVANGEGRRELVSGGLLASLGAADPDAVLPADARQFFNAPDITLIQARGAPAFYSLVIGSGDRANPRDSQTQDRLYVIRDRLGPGEITGHVPIRDADLPEITGHPDVPLSAPGWKLSLRTGEKVLAEAVTASSTALVTTYQPDAACGTNRLYALRVDSGASALDLNGDGEVTPEDVSETLAQTGIAGEVRITWDPPRPGDPGEPPSPTPAHSRCHVGDEVLSDCPQISRTTRTFWYRRGVD
jgi:type IV pilus assembly protein PilY1